jgi:uncharacterized protein (TIGR02118 family)
MKTTASLTEGQPYHNATIDGETPEMRDPRHNTGKLLASRNTKSAQSSRSARPGRAGFIWWPSYIFDSLDAIKAGLASPHGKAAAGDLANFAEGAAEFYFFDAKDV